MIEPGFPAEPALPPELSVAVVGANYPNKDGGNRRTEIAFCNPGEPLYLEREPKNPHDEYAVAVYSARSFQIGYVASQRAVLLSGLMRGGRELHAVFQDIAPWGAIARIGIDGPPVHLPPPQEHRRQTAPREEVDQSPTADFWPDEDYGID